MVKQKPGTTPYVLRRRLQHAKVQSQSSYYVQHTDVHNLPKRIAFTKTIHVLIETEMSVVSFKVNGKHLVHERIPKKYDA